MTAPASGGLRLAVLVCAGLAPVGWALFWAVFHTVPGQDWVVFHTAAARFFAGDLALLSDPRGFTDALNRSHAAWFAHPLLFHPWVYPPVTLLLALAFGWLPYLASLWVFLGVTLGLLVAALWRWQDAAVERRWLIVGVLACPATAFTLGAGQLGFLVAACVVAGIGLLPGRPFLAGLILGLLCLKPQFVLLMPVALLAGRHWRAIAGGSAGAAALVLASVAVAGVQPWIAWFGLAMGANPAVGKLVAAVRIYDQSVHTCLATLGVGAGVAGAGQMLATAASAACVWLVFARPAPLRQRLVVLLCAMAFGSPHVSGYDHVLLAVAAVMTMIDGVHQRRPVWLAAGVWLATAFNPPALIAVLGVPALTVLSALTVFLPGALMLVSVQARGGAEPVGSRAGAAFCFTTVSL